MSCTKVKNKYIGNPCKKEHDGLRYKSNKSCVWCAREWAKKIRKENPDYHADYQKEWRRIQKIKQATPAWMDEGEIERLYQERELLSSSMKMEFEVVYVIPLRSRVVCGLHVASNMKLVSKSLAKLMGWKFDSKKISKEQLELSRILSSIQ